MSNWDESDTNNRKKSYPKNKSTKELLSEYLRDGVFLHIRENKSIVKVYEKTQKPQTYFLYHYSITHRII